MRYRIMALIAISRGLAGRCNNGLTGCDDIQDDLTYKEDVEEMLHLLRSSDPGCLLQC